MKPKNFPGRKLIRKLKAEGKDPEKHTEEILEAIKKRSKKYRGKEK